MDLNEILAAIWLKLSDSVQSPSAAWRMPVLGTVSDDSPDLRTVVLRDVDIESWTLTCYTDSRSGKVRQLNANPTVSWLFYCPEERIQLRACGPAAIATSGPEVADAWESVPAFSRQNYLTEKSPGLPVENRVIVGGLDGDADEFADGLNNFAVLRSTLSQLVWLSVDGQRQISSIFTRTAAGITSAWRVP
jgi:hypothetical protein